MNDLSLVRPDFTSVGLVLPGRMTWDEWESTGRALQAIERAYPWWMGDWLNYGEHAWGETYTQAIEVTGHSLDRLQNYKWVANAVAMSDRYADLSWTHHRHVAKLPAEQQRLWLRLSHENGWASGELLAALRASQALPVVESTAVVPSAVLVPAQWVMVDSDRILIKQDKQAVMLSRNDVTRLITWFQGEGQWLEN